MMILVTGGSGSGKSAFAEDCVVSFGKTDSRFRCCKTLGSSLECRIRITITTKTRICELTVAIAAPATSSLGKGPMPRISSGSRIIFPASPIKFASRGVRESPCAVESPVSVRFR